MSTDLIEVRGLKLKGRIGVTPEERSAPQPVLISLAVRCDTRLAAATEDLSATLDYSKIVDRISQIVADEDFSLIETLADRVARLLLDDPRAQDCWVRVSKTAAPLSEDVDEVAVEISRDRSDISEEKDRP
jgi:7,8-dihydroneopterin aldolase/epimerase/oxygenase